MGIKRVKKTEKAETKKRKYAAPEFKILIPTAYEKKLLRNKITKLRKIVKELDRELEETRLLQAQKMRKNREGAGSRLIFSKQQALNKEQKERLEILKEEYNEKQMKYYNTLETIRELERQLEPEKYH